MSVRPLDGSLITKQQFGFSAANFVRLLWKCGKIFFLARSTVHNSKSLVTFDIARGCCMSHVVYCGLRLHLYRMHS